MANGNNNSIFQFLQANRVKANVLISDTINYLVDTYKQSLDVFSYSTSLGQLTLVVHNLFQMNLFYMQQAIAEQNFATANIQANVFGKSRLQGHNPQRGTSARGEITLRIKPGLEQTINGNFIFIPNYTKLKCLTNGLKYILDIGADDITFDVTNPEAAKVRIVEGALDAQIFQGLGSDLQSFEASVLPGKLIEDQFTIVSVNGEQIEQYDSMFDIPFGHKGCLVKTGMSSGIDIFFGNSINTFVPPLGSEVRVDYLLTNGTRGNILDKINAIFEFEDTGFDINGEDVNLNDFFEIQVDFAPNFGSDAEPIALTKILAPNISRNFIIHDDRSIKYFLGRMNFFSVIKVFKEITDNQNIFNTLLVPKIEERLSGGEDYFSAETTKFTLTDTEEVRLVNSIDESGRKSANITIKTLKPNLRKNVMFLFLEVFERYQGAVVRKSQVRKDVRDRLSTYFINNQRINKIPHSDIVRILDEIPYVDTVKVIFVPQNEEDIDTKGNISVGEQDMAIMRGGFEDAQGVFYEDEFDPEGETMGSVNLDISFVPNF